MTLEQIKALFSAVPHINTEYIDSDVCAWAINQGYLKESVGFLYLTREGHQALKDEVAKLKGELTDV